MKKPGIRTRKPKTLMDVPLGARVTEEIWPPEVPRLTELSRAFDDMAKRQPSVKRRGLKRLVRQFAYFLLART